MSCVSTISEKPTAGGAEEYRSLDSAATRCGSVATRNKRFRVGSRILERYIVTAELGQGGMGVVCKCLDTVGGVEVALKMLPPDLSRDTRQLESIRENFQLVSRLSHPNMASLRTLERDAASGEIYLIMENVEGVNLRQWLKRRGAIGGISLEQATPILRQVACVLDYAHEQGIVHRDIKPGNVMIRADGTVKVLDFGLAAEIRQTGDTTPSDRGVGGTVPYMAPEQWTGGLLNAAADQYALGVMAYEMLSGRLPFDDASPHTLKHAALTTIPQTIPGLPRSAMTALYRALTKHPDQRHPSCMTFVDALAAGNGCAPRPYWRRNRMAWGQGAIALALLTVAGLSVWLIRTPGVRRIEPTGIQARTGAIPAERSVNLPRLPQMEPAAAQAPVHRVVSAGNEQSTLRDVSAEKPLDPPAVEPVAHSHADAFTPLADGGVQITVYDAPFSIVRGKRPIVLKAVEQYKAWAASQNRAFDETRVYHLIDSLTPQIQWLDGPQDADKRAYVYFVTQERMP